MSNTPVTEGDVKLANVDSDRTDVFTECSKLSRISMYESQAQKLLQSLTSAEDERRDLLYELFERSIITEVETKKIRSCYNRLLCQLRTAAQNPRMQEKRELLRSKLRNYSEEFIKLVDERITPYYWVPITTKGNMLRLKADCLRYLFEVHPNCGQYQIRAHTAYSEAKSFFTKNQMTNSAEWYRLRLNYASLLYLDGFPTAAMYICQQLLKTNKLKRMDSAFESIVRKNVKFYKRAAMS